MTNRLKTNFNKNLNWTLNHFKDAENKNGDGWGHRWRGLQQLRYSYILLFLEKHFPKKVNFRVLDIGCALGDFTEKFMQQYPNAIVTGIDVSDKAIDIVSKRLPNATFKQSSLPYLPFKNSEFDLVLLCSVLSFLNDEGQLLTMKEVKRVIKKNGFLFFSNGIYEHQTYCGDSSSKELMKQFFNISDIEYNYFKLSVLTEKPFQFLNQQYIKLKHPFTIKPDWPFLKKIIAQTISLTFIRYCTLFLLYPLYFLSKLVISQKFIYRLQHSFCKTMLPNKTKSSIFILSKKSKS